MSIYLTVDIVLIAKQRDKFYILLIKRANNPFKDMWALPGGFVKENEECINAYVQEFRKKLNEKEKSNG